MRLISFFLTLLFVIGCGKPFETLAPIRKKAFVTKDNPNEKAESSFSVELEKENFSDVENPFQDEAGPTKPNALMGRFVGMVINRGEWSSSGLVEVKVKLSEDKDHPEKISDEVFYANSQDGQSEIQGGSGKYELQIKCLKEDCQHSVVRLTEKSTGQVATIKHKISVEYFQSEDLEDQKLGPKEEQLLKDAVEYHLPVIRNASSVMGAKTPAPDAAKDSTSADGTKADGSKDMDVLVIEHPKADLVDENFNQTPPAETTPDASKVDAGKVDTTEPDETKTDTPKPDTTVVNNPPPIEEQQVEDEKPLEIITAGHSLPPPKKDTPNVGQPGSGKKKPPTDLPKKTDEPKQPEPPVLKLTKDPVKAFGLKLPDQLLVNPSNVVRDPVKMAWNMSIVPAKDQKEFEPSYRMGVIAYAMVDQHIKIYLNACNFFVEAVLTLAGYINGANFHSYDFDKIFSQNDQGLQFWTKNQFFSGKNKTPGMQELTAVTDQLPDDYATVMTVDRRSLKRMGHVAILMRKEGKLVVIDSSMNDRGPRVSAITNNYQLLNDNRPDVKVFVYPGLLKMQKAK